MGHILVNDTNHSPIVGDISTKNIDDVPKATDKFQIQGRTKENHTSSLPRPKVNVGRVIECGNQCKLVGV